MTTTTQFLQCLACKKGNKERGRKIKEKGEAQCGDHQWSDKLEWQMRGRKRTASKNSTGYPAILAHTHTRIQVMVTSSMW